MMNLCLTVLVLFALVACTAGQGPCKICGPQSSDSSCTPNNPMPAPLPEKLQVQSSICTEIETNYKDYHNLLCEKYPKPNGYYYECTTPGTSNTFSCRSSCGPPLEDVGKGLNLDLLKGGGLFGSLNKQYNNQNQNLFDFNNFNKDQDKNGNADFGNFATLGSFGGGRNTNRNLNNLNLFGNQGAASDAAAGNANANNNFLNQPSPLGGIGGGGANTGGTQSGPPPLNQVPPSGQFPPNLPTQNRPQQGPFPSQPNFQQNQPNFQQNQPNFPRNQFPNQPNLGPNVPQNQPNVGQSQNALQNQPSQNQGYSQNQPNIGQGLPQNPPNFGQNFPQNLPNPGQNFPQNQPNVGQNQPNVGQNFPQNQPSVGQTFPQNQPNVGQNFPQIQTNVGQASPQSQNSGGTPPKAGPNFAQNQPNLGQSPFQTQPALPRLGTSGGFDQGLSKFQPAQGSPQSQNEENPLDQIFGPSFGQAGISTQNFPKQSFSSSSGTPPQNFNSNPGSGASQGGGSIQQPQQGGSSKGLPNFSTPQAVNFPANLGSSSSAGSFPTQAGGPNQAGNVPQNPGLPGSSQGSFPTLLSQQQPGQGSGAAFSQQPKPSQGSLLYHEGAGYPSQNGPLGGGASAGNSYPSQTISNLPSSQPKPLTSYTQNPSTGNPASNSRPNAYPAPSPQGGASDAYQAARQGGQVIPKVAEGDYPPIEISNNGKDIASKGPAPGLFDVPGDNKNAGQGSRPTPPSPSSQTPTNTLPAEAFQNPFQNPSSPFSRRTDSFDSNPAFVGTSLIGEGFLDSPGSASSRLPIQRGPDTVDIGGNELFPGFQQFEKPGGQGKGGQGGLDIFGSTPLAGQNSPQGSGGMFDSNFLSSPGRSNFLSRQQSPFASFSQPGPPYQNQPASNTNNPAFPQLGRETQNSVNDAQPQQAGGGASVFQNVGGANGAETTPFRPRGAATFSAANAQQAEGGANQPYAGGANAVEALGVPNFPKPNPQNGGGVNPFQTGGGANNGGANAFQAGGVPNFPAPNLQNGGGASPFQARGGANQPNVGGTNPFQTESGSSSFPARGAQGATGFSGFPSTTNSQPSRTKADTSGFYGFGNENKDGGFGFPGEFGSFNDAGFANKENKSFDKSLFSDELFKDREGDTQESGKSTSKVKESGTAPADPN